MKSASKALLFTALALCALDDAAAQRVRRAEAAGGGSDPNQVARLLAGLPPGGRGHADALASSAEWQRHAAFMDANWAKFDRWRIAPIREFTRSELDVRGAVFYPFSGPDFIYVHNFFPRASTYILAALEPVGQVPSAENISPETLRPALGHMQASLNTLLTAGYFVTKEMRAGLRISGTLPVLYVMLARSGCTIHDVKSLPGGVQIRFSSTAGGRQTLFYMSCDLSNGGFKGNRGLQALLRDSGARTAFIKADSYLLHRDGFSALRTALLRQFRVIVQDDSGIPIRYFDPGEWKLRYYGTYTPPLDIFREYYQPELAQVYTSTPTRPLEFGFGYKWNPKEATLIVASRR